MTATVRLLLGRVVVALGSTMAVACAGPDRAAETALNTPPTRSASDGNANARFAPAPDIRAEQLLGLDGVQLAGLLGPADFVRSDGPTEIWQFRGADCVLDVFLYLDRQGAYRVEHVEGRDHEMVRAADQSCISALLRARRAHAGTG